TDLEKLHPNRRGGCPRQFGAGERDLAQPLHQRIREGGPQQAQRVGEKGMATGAGTEEVQLRFLGAIVFAASLRLTPSGLSLPFDPVEWVGFPALTVELVIEHLCWKVKVGHHAPRIGALEAKLQPGDDAPFDMPRVGRIAEFVNTALLDSG